MQLQPAIRDNLRFLLAEVGSQVSQLRVYFEDESPSIARHIVEHAGYAYNLKQRVQDGCMRQISDHRKADAMGLRAVAAIATELERIAELCRECVDQLAYLRDDHQLDLSVYRPLLRRVGKGLDLVESALLTSDTELALKLGRAEDKLDRSSRKLVDRYTEALKREDHTEDLVAGLLIARIVGQMGGALLTISESIISSSIGQPMDTQRYHSLRETLADWINDEAFEAIEVRQVAETRSGAGISSLAYDGERGERLRAIFKEGDKRKLKEERKGVERWHETFPGVAPQILTWTKQGKQAALLIEHLDGLTFEELVLGAPDEQRRRAMGALAETLQAVWTTTLRDEPVPARFVRQARKRLGDVYAIHPDFRAFERRIGSYRVPSFEQPLDRAEALEASLPPPFSVFIHGDFNLDNIIYDPEADKVNFIDLHRSTHLDYLQDVSVFMVSNLRLPVVDAPSRSRIRDQVLTCYAVARTFAEAHDDRGFEARLALGLARSCATSTRFIRDPELARRLFLSARYLLESVLALGPEPKPKQLAAYRIKLEELLR